MFQPKFSPRSRFSLERTALPLFLSCACIYCSLEEFTMVHIQSLWKDFLKELVHKKDIRKRALPTTIPFGALS